MDTLEDGHIGRWAHWEKGTLGEGHAYPSSICGVTKDAAQHPANECSSSGASQPEPPHSTQSQPAFVNIHSVLKAHIALATTSHRQGRECKGSEKSEGSNKVAASTQIQCLSSKLEITSRLQNVCRLKASSYTPKHQAMHQSMYTTPSCLIDYLTLCDWGCTCMHPPHGFAQAGFLWQPGTCKCCTLSVHKAYLCHWQLQDS